MMMLYLKSPAGCSALDPKNILGFRSCLEQLHL